MQADILFCRLEQLSIIIFWESQTVSCSNLVSRAV